MRKILFTLGGLLLSCLCVFSQLKDWGNYTNNDLIRCMLSDGDYLWIGTNGGIVKLNKSTGEKHFYTRCDGLPNNKISALALDGNGGVWTSSENCVISKFNGTGFDILEATARVPVRPAMPNQALHVDQSGRIWYGALAIYTKDQELGTDKILGWKLPNTSIQSNKLVSSFLFTTVNGEEVLYIGGQIGSTRLLKFDGKELYPILKSEIPSAVTALAPGENGNIWIATQGKGLMSYAPDGTLTTFNTSNSNILANQVYDMKTDHRGDYWLACQRSLVKFDGKDFIAYQTGLIESMGDMNCMTYVLPEEDGTVWVGTKKQGLFKFANGEFTPVDIAPAPLLADNYMAFSMCVDKVGNVWSAGRQELLKIDTENGWHSLFKLDGKSVPAQNRIQAVKDDLQGNVWVALSMSDTCVVKLSPEGVVMEAFTGTAHPILKAGTQRESCFVSDLQGNVWWGTYAGLYRYNGKTWECYTTDNSPIPCNAITDLKVDSKGSLWGTVGFLGEEGGVFKFDGSAWTVYTTKNSPLPTTFAMCLDIDSKDRIWLHCRDRYGNIGKDYGSGLTCFDGERWISYTTANSDLPSNTIWDIAIDKYDNIWIGTAEMGLTCLDSDGTWTNYNTMNSGIASNEVSCILVDEFRNRVWMNHLFGGGMSSATFDEAYGISFTPYLKNARILIEGQSLLCTSPNAVKLEIYTLDAVKVGEARFTNGEATVTVDKVPATYLYAVTYPDGRRESGKVMMK